MIFNNCVLFSDVDGTLSTYDRTIPKTNIDAINYFVNNGGKFALATGRAVNSTKKILKGLAVNTPCIIYNGGEIYDFAKDQSVHGVMLPESAKKHLDEVDKLFPEAGLEIHIQRVLYCIKESNRSREHIMLENNEFKVYNLQDLPADGWHKILITGTDEVVEEVARYYENKSTEEYYFLRSEPGLFEILPIEASKGKALKRYCEIFNADIEKVFAIGDYYNDEEMIKSAGYSAVTAESPQQLKAVARYITCSSREGAVADFIKHIEGLMREKNIGQI